MEISYCIPTHKRNADLFAVMPSLVAAANASPPVEIVILNYNADDQLDEYVKEIKLKEGNSIVLKKYMGNGFFHMAHAKNLSVLASKGKYVVVGNADILTNVDFFREIRRILKETKAVWLRSSTEQFRGILVVEREEFIESGGHDERFEFYSPDDKDFIERLTRRGKKSATYPSGLLDIIPTSNKDKARNYRLKISKWDMKKLMHPIYFENQEKQTLVANPEGWGSWEKK